MTTQEIINELTKYDRLVIMEMLLHRGKYCRRYMDYMFTKGRKRTDLFKQTIRVYWVSKQGLIQKMDELMDKFSNKEEELV